MQRSFRQRALRSAGLTALALGLAFVPMAGASATSSLTQVSIDVFSNTTSAHHTQVEPDTFSYGSTIVSAFQSGRFSDGGSSDIGWATSTDNGVTWKQGFLPVTVYAGGSYARVSDPAVAYNARYNVWLISSLPLDTSLNAAVAVNRSTDGGLTWGKTVNVTTPPRGLDKDWIACDNTATSPFYGRCYVEFDDNGNGNTIYMSTSSDGGLTWGTPVATADKASGLGGQPLVEPNGAVIVPIQGGITGVGLLFFYSANGGASWSKSYTIAIQTAAVDPGQMRTGPLPSAEIDGSGVIYTTWEDCRFETNCATNDVVIERILGPNAYKVQRVPISPVGSGIDYMIPGIAVDRSTSGSSAHLAITYYYFPKTSCTIATCQLYVGFISSMDGGTTWSTPVTLAGPMQPDWLAPTTQGYMVGDYISTSFLGNGKASSVFAVATQPSGTTLNESMFAPTAGLSLAADTIASSNDAVLSAPQSTDRHGGSLLLLR